MPYKDELKSDLMKLIERYFNEEVGNRMTSFSMNGLISNINSILEKNVEKIKEE